MWVFPLFLFNHVNTRPYGEKKYNSFCIFFFFSHSCSHSIVSISFLFLYSDLVSDVSCICFLIFQFLVFPIWISSLSLSNSSSQYSLFLPSIHILLMILMFSFIIPHYFISCRHDHFGAFRSFSPFPHFFVFPPLF